MPTGPEWIGVAVAFVLVSLGFEGLVRLNRRFPIARLIQSLVTGTSTVMAVLLVVEYVTITDQIETGIHQIYHVLLLVAAILCVGLSMVCWRWYVASDEDTTPTRSEPSPINLEEQRERVRAQVQQEKAARQDQA